MSQLTATGQPTSGGAVAATTPIVMIEGVSHRYGDRIALEGIDLEARSGEILGLLGPNGSGKTTLFRILSTLLAPTAGRVRIDGLDVGTQRDAVRRRLGVVFQSPSLDRELSAGENLRHHGHLYGLRGSELNRRIDRMLERFGLADRRSERVRGFSGGMRRRVEIAKGLITQPRVLILDEPSTGLDLAAREDLLRMLQQVRDEGIAVLLTTHLMEEADHCDRLAILDQGRLVATGSPADLRSRMGRLVVSMDVDQPGAMVQRLGESMGIDAGVVDGIVRFECSDAVERVGQWVELAGRGSVRSITIGRPSLGDVFISLTGRRFEAGADSESPASAGHGGK